MAENNKKSVPVYEQETHISYMRDEQFAKVYTSDTTQMTKFDKRCKDFPDMWMCVSNDGYSKSYICKDKSMISARGKKAERQKRELTDEEREIIKKRLAEGRTKKNVEINSKSAPIEQ